MTKRELFQYHNVFVALWNKVSSFFYYSAYFNLLYNFWFLDFFKIAYNFTNKYIDKGSLELFGPFGLYKLLHILSLNVQFFTPTIVFFTVGWMFFFLTLFLLFFFFHFLFFSFLTLNVSLLYLLLFLCGFSSAQARQYMVTGLIRKMKKSV